ncbi:MAG: hypothetical protein GY952_18890, partial [Rhodobacteraceae bacterium]|nr:hypothetical protein [Paracoccaceae bacterium]
MIQWAEVRRRVSLWGRVLEDEQPIAGAQVELIPKGDADAFKRLLAIRAKQHGRRWKNLRERPDRRRSAVDGLFYFLDLPEGHYQVRVVLAGDRIKTREATITQVEKSKAPQVDLHFVSEPNWSSQGCRLRLHAGHLKLSNGSPVERWPDINHKGIQASQTEPGRQPSYVSKGFNGRAAVRFDGNNHSLKLEGFESESTSHTFFFVYDHDNKDGLHSNYLCDFYADNEYLLTLDCFYTTHPHHIRWRSKDAKAWQEVAKADK